MIVPIGTPSMKTMDGSPADENGAAVERLTTPVRPPPEIVYEIEPSDDVDPVGNAPFDALASPSVWNHPGLRNGSTGGLLR